MVGEKFLLHMVEIENSAGELTKNWDVFFVTFSIRTPNIYFYVTLFGLVTSSRVPEATLSVTLLGILVKQP